MSRLTKRWIIKDLLKIRLYQRLSKQLDSQLAKFTQVHLCTIVLSQEHSSTPAQTGQAIKEKLGTIVEEVAVRCKTPLTSEQIIAKGIRDLLMIEEPDWTRSISVPPRSNLGTV